MLHLFTFNIRKLNISGCILGLMFFFSSLLVFQIPFHSMTYFIVLEVIFCGYMFLWKKSLYFSDMLLTLFMFEIVCSAFLSFFYSTIPLSYRKTALYMTALILPSYFVVMYLNQLITEKPDCVYVLKWAIKAMCVAQIGWSLIQFVCYRVGIDLNKVVFEDLLHMLENASSGKIAPSGFAWHPAILAPVVVLTFYLFDNIWIKMAAVFVALTCKNATALLGVMLCIAIEVFYIVKSRKIKINKFLFKILLVLGMIAIAGGIKLGIFQQIFDKILFIFQRIAGTVQDDSAMGHKRYFTALPRVWGVSSVSQILFGYGTGCSGYAIDRIFQQFTLLGLGNWAVESDIMNILYSWGIFGFVLYYSMLLYIMLKGGSINRKYTCACLIITLQGITYNIQYEGMMLIMMTLYICVKRKIDIFEATKDWEEKQCVDLA